MEPKRRAGLPLRAKSAASQRRKIDPERRKSLNSIPMDKISMQVMEANEISQYLKKEYTFKRVSEDEDNEHLIQIKVINKKLGLSCVWTFAKLKERLMRMRKLMYAGDNASSQLGAESVFFDPQDTWIKEDGSEPLTNGNAAQENALKSIENDQDLQNGQHTPVIMRTGRSKSAKVRRPISFGTNASNGTLMSTGGSSSGSELPGESEFISLGPTSTIPTTPETPKSGGLPERYFISHMYNESRPVKLTPAKVNSTNSPLATSSPTQSTKSSPINGATAYMSSPKRPKPAEVCPKCQKSQSHNGVVASGERETVTDTVFAQCHSLLKATVENIKGATSREESLIDKIMLNCESVKVAVINILEAFTHAQASTGSPAAFAESELTKISNVHLVAALELLVSHTSLLSTIYEDVDGTSVKDITAQINVMVKDLGSELLTFLQGCENNADTIATDSSLKIIDLLFDLVKLGGELAMSVDLCPASVTSLLDPERASIDELLSLKPSKEDDVLHPKISMDTKQSFLGGCDQYVEQRLQESVSSVGHSEAKVYEFKNQCQKYQQGNAETSKHIVIVVSKAKLLVQKCQDVQSDLNSKMKEDDTKSENYFHRYFTRCQQLLKHVRHLVDSVSYLSQASESLPKEESGASLRKVARCSEMIHKAATKLIGASNQENHPANSLNLSSGALSSLVSANGLSLDLKSESSEASILSDVQSDQVDQAGVEVKMSVHSLTRLIKKRLADNPALASSGKTKRTLPNPPGGVVSSANKQQRVRCQSARLPDRKSMTKHNSLVDLSES